MPLDEFLPDYDANEVHSTRVAAPPDRALAAARGLSGRDVPLARALMAVRTLPKRLRGHRRGREIRGPTVDAFIRNGFVVLADRPDELVLGAIGRFWQPKAEMRRITPGDFAAFDESGWAKAVFNFEVRAEPGGGSVLTTETRIKGTDAAATRSFRRYWRVIGPFSAGIRRAWLRAIRKRAEAG